MGGSVALLRSKLPWAVGIELVFVLVAWLQGAALRGAVTRGGLFLLVVFGITYVLEDPRVGLVANLERVVPPEFQTTLKAVTSNLGELVTVMGILFSASAPALAAVLAGALYSNPVNMLLMAATLLAATASRYGPARVLSLGRRRLLRPDLSEHTAVGVLLAVAAMGFVTVARFEEARILLLGVATLHAALFAFLFRRYVTRGVARTKSLLEATPLRETERHIERLAQVPHDNLQDFLRALKKVLAARQPLSRGFYREFEAHYQAVRSDLLQGPERPSSVPEGPALSLALEALLVDDSARKSALWLRSFGFRFGPRRRWVTRDNVGAVGLAGLATVALAFLGAEIGPAAESLGAALHLPLEAIMVFAALASSLPEAVLMFAAFRQRKDLEGGAIASLSNLMNLGIAVVATVMFFVRSGWRWG